MIKDTNQYQTKELHIGWGLGGRQKHTFCILRMGHSLGIITGSLHWAWGSEFLLRFPYAESWLNHRTRDWIQSLPHLLTSYQWGLGVRSYHLALSPNPPTTCLVFGTASPPPETIQGPSQSHLISINSCGLSLWGPSCVVWGTHLE